MITLAATNTLQATAGTNTAITCTVTGLESSIANGEVFKVLDQRVLTTSVVALYTVPASTTAYIKEILLSNTTASPVASVRFFVNGSAVGNQIVRLTIPANGTATFDSTGWKVYDSVGALQYVGSTGAQGAKGATWKGAYSGGTAYVLDDVVFDNGSAWINISPSTGVAPPTLPTTSNANWNAVSIKGDKGLQYRGAWSGATTYVLDDVVTDNGSAWICILGHSPSHAPPSWPGSSSNTWWSIVAGKGDTGSPGVITTISTPSGSGLSGGGSAATITPQVVVDGSTIEIATNTIQVKDGGIGLAKQANLTQAQIRGRKLTAGTGPPQDMTPAEAKAVLAITNTDVSGLGSLATQSGTFSGTSSGTNTGDVTLGAAGAAPNANAATLTGQQLVLQPASTSFAGNMSSADKTKLDAITGTNTGDVTLGAAGSAPNANAASLAGQVLTLQPASTAFAGNMSAADKVKLNGKFVDAVAELGLKKDGSDAAGNTTKLQTAMTGSTFTGGGVLYFPAGTYAFNDTITIDKAIIFTGAGRSISNLRFDDVQKTHFAMVFGAQGAGFEQLRFTGDTGPPGQFRTGRPTKTTIAAGSNDVILPPAGNVLNLVSSTGLLPATPSAPQHLQYEANYPQNSGTPYWGTLTYTGITGNQLTGVTTQAVAAGRYFKTGGRIQQGGFAVDFGDTSNVYIQQCDILFHKSGVRSAGALQFMDDCNIREMNNAGKPAGPSIDTGDSGTVGWLASTASQCIHIDGFGDRYLRRITTDNAGDWAFMAGIRISQCASCVITDCNIINMNWALDICADSGLFTSLSSVMALNSFFDSSTIGIRIRCATANDTAQRIRFVQCWASTQTQAGATIEHANCTSIDFIGCDFFQSPVGLDILAAGDWGVRASRFSGATTAGIRTAANATNRFTIADNFIGNGAGFGANALGVNIQAGTYLGYQISDNRGLESNTTPGITDNGTVAAPGEKVVRDNMGTGANNYAVRMTATQLLNSSVLADLVGLSFPIVQPNLRYAFDVMVPVNIVASAASGFGIAINAPAGATVQGSAVGAPNSVAVRHTYFTQINTAQTGMVTTSGFTGAVRVSGVIMAGTATSHTGQVQIRGHSAGTASTITSTATVNLGGWLIANKV